MPAWSAEGCFDSFAPGVALLSHYNNLDCTDHGGLPTMLLIAGDSLRRL